MKPSNRAVFIFSFTAEGDTFAVVEAPVINDNGADGCCSGDCSIQGTGTCHHDTPAVHTFCGGARGVIRLMGVHSVYFMRLREWNHTIVLCLCGIT
jgi:hypothetical protein